MSKQRKVNICGIDCKRKGDGQCNGYCTGEVDHPRSYTIDQCTIEELLSMKVKGKNGVLKEQGKPCEVEVSPEFRVAVQNITDEGVHIIIHANGHNSDTIDLLVKDNKVSVINNSERIYED